MFIESRTSQELFERLKDLDPCVALHWVMAGKNSVMYIHFLHFFLLALILTN